MHALFMELKVIFGGYQDIVHVYDQPSFGYLLSKDHVHHCLKGGRGISQSKEHDSGFEQPLICDKCCFIFITFFDAYVVVSPPDAYFGEHLCVLYMCYEL